MIFRATTIALSLAGHSDSLASCRQAIVDACTSVTFTTVKRKVALVPQNCAAALLAQPPADTVSTLEQAQVATLWTRRRHDRADHDADLLGLRLTLVLSQYRAY